MSGKTARLGQLAAAISFITVLGTNLVSAQEERHRHNGAYLFTTTTGVISLPTGALGVAFDSSYSSADPQVPPYQLIGQLKVDSLLFRDSAKEIDNQEDVAGLSIHSNRLVEVLNALGVTRLVRLVPWAIPGDTLFWDSVRQKWHVEPDLSTHYIIHADSTIGIRVFDSLFRTVSDLRSWGPVPTSHVDSGVFEPIENPPQDRLLDGDEPR